MNRVRLRNKNKMRRSGRRRETDDELVVVVDGWERKL
jgi:hypothetical protein